MMMTFITRRGEGQGKTKKGRKATKSEGRGLEEGASRALMPVIGKGGSVRKDLRRSFGYSRTVRKNSGGALETVVPLLVIRVYHTRDVPSSNLYKARYGEAEYKKVHRIHLKT